jgi:CheY-like chemotaxis protein
MILLDLPKNSPLRDPMETILKSGERASNIVMDLLTLARRGVSVSQRVLLNDIIRDYLNSPEYETLKGYHPDFEMRVALAPDLLDISGSSIHLTKTVMNLISNAAEATGRDGRISLTTENRYIDKPVQGYDDIKEGDYVVLQVADNGVGISAQDIKHIFEPFYTKKIMGRSGTGLGMAVVWGAVKDHDGYIDVQSTENQGTVVTAYFPASRDRHRDSVELEAAASHMGRGEYILVVDDVEGQRLIAAEMLTRLGYEVALSANGEQAIEMVRRRRPDLLLLDMIMDPGIDGLETYRRILDIYPEQRALITSGFSESESVHRAQALGAGAYVKKPYRLKTIARAVREELER